MAVNNLTCCFCLWDGVIGRLSHFPRQDHQQEKADHVEFDHFVQESKGLCHWVQIAAAAAAE